MLKCLKCDFVRVSEQIGSIQHWACFFTNATHLPWN